MQEVWEQLAEELSARLVAFGRRGFIDFNLFFRYTDICSIHRGIARALPHGAKAIVRIEDACMKKDKLDSQRVDNIIKLAAKAVGGASGATIGFLISGIEGAITGRVSGAFIEETLVKIGMEVRDRIYSKREAYRVGTVLGFAAKHLEEGIASGKKIRDDDFFNETSSDDRSSADEVLEGLVLAAQRENEEKKLQFMGKLFANIAFDTSVSRAEANQLINAAESLSYRQICLLKALSILKVAEKNGVPLLYKKQFGSISGNEMILIASELYGMCAQGYLFSTSVVLDPPSICPANLVLSGVSGKLYSLMELLTTGDNQKDLILPMNLLTQAEPK